MGISTAAILALFLAGLCERAQCAEKVQLGFYSESLCPDCIYFANEFLEKAMKEVMYKTYYSDILLIFGAPDWRYLHTELRPLG